MRIGWLGSGVAIALTTVNLFVAACSTSRSGEASNTADGSSPPNPDAPDSGNPDLGASDSGPTPPNASDAETAVDAAADGSPACGVTLPVACPASSPPKYDDVAPFFDSRCASCHTGVGGAPWPLATYDDVSNWDDLVKADLEDCSMPPADAASPMPLDERIAILRWLACGRPH